MKRKKTTKDLLFVFALVLMIMVVTRSGKGGMARFAAGLAMKKTTTPKSNSSVNNIRNKKMKASTSAIAKTSKIVTPETKVNPKRRRLSTPSTESVASHHIRQEKSVEDVRRKLLFSLPDDIVIGVVQNRPSKRNRSPYVADVLIEEEGQQQREVLVHVPNLDMGGKCVPGTKILMKPARDKKGNLVGSNAINPKYGTPKCEYIAQLIRVDDTERCRLRQQEEDGSTKDSYDIYYYEPTWVGAHPSLGETIAEQLISQNLLGPNFPKVKSYQREVRNVGGTDMRVDFLIEHDDITLPKRIVEVKTVVDTDYSCMASPSPGTMKCVYINDEIPYQRTAIFPWGTGNQKGPNGEKVVSARAIKHVRELTKLVDKGKDDNNNKKNKHTKNATTTVEKYDATILFVVIRGDAKYFRPNHEACPSFAKYLKEAKDVGVQVLATQVVWGEEKDNELGNCYYYMGDDEEGEDVKGRGGKVGGNLLDIKWP